MTCSDDHPSANGHAPATPDPELLNELAAIAHEDRPRLFAIYGTYRRDPHAPVLGWGIEFPTGGTLYRSAYDRAIHSADSAERVLEVHSLIGHVQLAWLDT
ncbi:hypothetical protein SAMN06265360_10189 [Haloechinothrix alba]|uniref:Uncharacterized protein n=1 Tax=Haloechinothrix alba TaxID=664784 RepID=A0A238V0P0_9PSEU|nr:hypothetical protein [Haloechinothrix alba]SNR27577.1 hypothetical protein SAMN06265360_10189 [Haloechinothrix alba]